MNDQHFYDAVAVELQNRQIRPGLWTRAVAETEDTGDAARAAYIRLRVAELVAAAEMQKNQPYAEERLRKTEARRQFAQQYAAGIILFFTLLGIAIWIFFFVI